MKYNLQINVEATSVEELHQLIDQAITEAKETINEYGIPGSKSHNKTLHIGEMKEFPDRGYDYQLIISGKP